MEQQQALDLETAPLADIRKAVEEDERRARDPETGRFVAKEDKAAEAKAMGAEIPDDAEIEAIVYRTVIDLGDGSGTQVFEADSQQALTDKLVEAQTNATKKIRQQEAELRELRTRTAEKPKPTELTEDEKFVFKQEFDKDPYAAFDKIFQKRTGMSMEELQRVKARLDAEDQEVQKGQALQTFFATHEDYEDSPFNSELMKRELKGERVIDGETLHKAYLSLKKSGLLKLKGSEANADAEQRAEVTERIAQPRQEVTQTRTRRASGISSQGRPTPTPQEPTEDDAYNMPLEKLRQLANRQLGAR